LAAVMLAAAPAARAAAAPAAALNGGQVAFANSGSAAAQGPFLAGLAWLHDFEYPRAAQAFRQAQAADPSFAMAYWGEAMTYNHAVWMEQDAAAARAVLARLGPTREARLAKAATPRERDYLAAVETLYGEGTKAERDFRYADAMAAIHARFPDDVDATAFYALALLGTCHEGRDFATYMRAAALLEEVYPTHMRHPGVLHYMIHSYDDPIHAPLGLRAAERYGAVAPDAPHALHMTSHIFIAMGMWDEVITANLNSTRRGNALRASVGRGPVRCGHAISWLMYGYLQERRDGEAAATLAACKISAEAQLAAAKPAGLDPDRNEVGSYVAMRLMQAVDAGRWAPAERLDLPPGGYASPRFHDAYGAAVAALRADDAPALRAAGAKLAELAAPLMAEIAADPAGRAADRQTVQVMVDEMNAAARIRGGDADAGLAALRKAAQSEAALPVEFGPPAVALPAWELLGDELLRAHRPAEAAAAYRAALARAPGRTRSLEGLLGAEQASGAATAQTAAELARYRRTPA
jgi:hypothetical protein